MKRTKLCTWPYFLTFSDFEFRKSTKPFKFESGLNQKFEQDQDLLEPSECKEEELVFSPDQVVFPVVIVLTPDQPKPKKNDNAEIQEVNSDRKGLKVSAQITFATLLKCSDESYVIKFVKQKVLVINLFPSHLLVQWKILCPS